VGKLFFPAGLTGDNGNRNQCDHSQDNQFDNADSVHSYHHSHCALSFPSTFSRASVEPVQLAFHLSPHIGQQFA